MKLSKGTIILLLLSGMIFYAAQSAFGGCEVSYLGDFVELQGNAPGTKYEGPLTVYFATSDDTYPSSDMYYFLRLRKGKNLYSFAGVTPNIDCRKNRDSVHGQLGVIETFLDNTVIPSLYPDECGAGACPEYVFKSYAQDVNEEDSPYSNTMLFWILDIVIAVQD